MNKKQAQSIVGTLGKPSKMPGMSYGIPAAACNVGGKLSKHAGTTCSNCYAKKANYRYPSVAKAQEKRLASLYELQWVDAMVYLITDELNKGMVPFFRWHDSGDLQSLAHLRNIVEVAKRLPQVSFWLPTREYGLIQTWMKHESVPANLVIRVSAPMLNSAAPAWASHSSQVHTGARPDTNGVHVCPAPKQGNACRDCRACWSHDVTAVSYHVH